MTHRYDGSSIDIEKRSCATWSSTGSADRMLLERIAKYGAVTALAPIVAACTGGGATASPARRCPAASNRFRRPAGRGCVRGTDARPVP